MNVPSLIANRYEVLESLGSGGFGSVLKVRDQTTQEILALKCFATQNETPEQVHRFQREFRLLSRIDHAHIVSVKDAGSDGEILYFTMEYLQGVTLERVLKTPNAPQCLALRSGGDMLQNVLVQLCDALAYIHARGLVHRDLKPANVFLTSSQAGPQVKLLDLGMVKFKEEGREALTEEGVMLGTVHYMSPEQIRGVHVDARADLYTLGVVLYEILAGQKPFEGRNSAAVILKHLNEVPVPPRVYNLNIPHALQLIVLKLLEKEPERRYRSAEDLLADLVGPKMPPTALAPNAPPALLLHTRFLGRQDTMAKARNLLADAQRGEGQVLAVTGEPGIGKTRFLEELKADAGLQGIVALSTTCFAERTRPFQPVIEMFRAAEKALGELKAWIKLEDRTELARLFPELADPTDSVLHREDQTVLFEALHRLLETLTQRTPILFCLDDLQWADQGTLDFIGFLGERLEGMSLFLCVAHRPFESTPPEWFDQIESLLFSPLTQDSIENLLASLFGTTALPESLTREVYGISGGNPFFALEATKALVARGAVEWQKNRWVYARPIEGLPDQVEAVLYQRMEHLPESEHGLLAFASTLNRPFDFDLIFAFYGGEEEALFDFLERLVRKNFLRKNLQDHYSLFHGLTAEVTYGSLTPERRQNIHTEIGRILEALQRDEQTGETAYHFLLADMPEKALPYLVKAGDQALSVYAYASARQAYEKALGILDSSEQSYPDIYADLLCNYVDVLRWTGQWTDVKKYAEQGLKRQELNAHHRARLCQNSGVALGIKGQYAASEEFMQKALQHYDKLSDWQGKLRAQVYLINIYWFTGKYSQASQCVASAVSLCQHSGDDFYQALGHYLLGNNHLTNSRFAQGESAFQDALQAFESIKKEKRYIQMCRAALREIYTYRGKLNEAAALSQQLIDTHTGRGDIHSAYETLDLGYIHFEQGELKKAEDGYLFALNALLKSNQRQKLPLAYARLSELYVNRGEGPKALKFASQAEEILGFEPIRRCQVYRALGMAHAANAFPEEAVGYFEKSLKALQDLKGFQFALSLFESGKFHLSIGDAEIAEDQLGQAVGMFTQMGADHFLKKAQGVLSELTKTIKKPDVAQTPSAPPAFHAPEPPLSLDTDQLLNEAIDRFLYLTSADRGMILTVQNGKPHVQTACSRQLDASSVADISLSVVQAAIEAATLIVTADAANDPRFRTSQSIVNHNIGSILCMPLKSRNGQVIGAVYADHEGATFFSERDVSFFKSFGEFVAVALENALRFHHLQQDLEKLAGIRTRFGDLVGTSSEMQTVYDMVERLSGTDVNVLLQGETGTGKGLVARTIHAWSTRTDKPFLLQNCGALPLEMLESELFGHCKGAFTGASFDRPGLFEAADGGTVFLDEIGEAPPKVQVQLLHVLEEGTIRRLGENRMRKVDVRVIAATNRDLEAEVKANRFRQDLYYRLKVITILIPPLRVRPDDILLLATHFLQFWNQKMSKKVVGFTQDVKSSFLRHTWPGNIRELENEIQRGVALCAEGETIGIEHLSESFSRLAGMSSLPAPEGNLKAEVERYERDLVIAALEKNAWNITHTARQLGLSRVGFKQKLKKYGIERPNNPGGR